MVINWIEMVIGFWVLISPWLLGFSSISLMKWNNLIVGLALILLNVWVIFGDKNTPPEVTESGKKS